MLPTERGKILQEGVVQRSLLAENPRGRKGGRPAKLSPKEVKTIRALLKTADIHVAEIATRFGIARSNSIAPSSPLPQAESIAYRTFSGRSVRKFPFLEVSST